ncbi:SET and MYND domain-containing protein 4-like isoform X1 [Watersipora subatra]|uniref:SET and MYND domain-containing protein 4-like isoform X1 n=1 Tax=Watersipora subatra TaxID=2589382 RepID=UPI00355B2BE2
MEGHFQTAYRRLSDYISANNLEKTFTCGFSKLAYKEDCINYLLELIGTTDLLRLPKLKTDKNMALAAHMKANGNKYFQRKMYDKACSTYSHALRLCSLTDSDSLVAVCFANRSASLFGLEKYIECLFDIEMAVKHGYPDGSFYKLLVRKAKCHQYVDKDQLDKASEMALNAIDQSNLSSDCKMSLKNDLAHLSAKPRQSFHKTSPKLGGNDKCSTLCQSAVVVENNEFGRFVQATDDICSGQIVLMEKPYCSVCLPSSYLSHCCYCQKRVDYTPYPCRACADVVYCEPDCETDAWEQFHRFECDYILSIKNVGVNMGHLALRSALQAGYAIVKKAFSGNVIEHVTYRNIFTLQGHYSERSCKDMLWRTVAAIVLANMCDVRQWHEAGDATKLLATAVLHHMDIFPCNAHEISELIYDANEPCKSTLEEIGAGIYQTLSMFNHSCDPSVVRTFYNGNTCVMNALSPIQKSEQIYDNYGCLYATHSLDTRQKKLESQYYFKCGCEPCVHDWNLYSKMQYQDLPVYKCSKCRTMVLPPYGDQCDNCLQPFEKSMVDEILTKTKECIDALLAQLFSCGDMAPTATRDKAKKLEDYSELVNKLVFRPYKPLNDCQEALKHVYSLLGNAVLKDQAIS